MNKKMGFLTGLILGGAAAIIAFKRLDPIKRQKLIDKVNQRVSTLKNKAVDYAFYASDTMGDATTQLHRGANGATSHAKSALNLAHRHANQLKDRFMSKYNNQNNKGYFHTSADHLDSELNQNPKSDDIVIDADHNFDQISKKPTIVYYPNGITKRY